jgi:hypothetical protein
MTNATAIGRKVLAGLEKAHRVARPIQQAKVLENLRLIVELAALDQSHGRPAWGRAGRIARKLSGVLSERTVKRYLDRLAAMSDFGGMVRAEIITEDSPYDTPRST